MADFEFAGTTQFICHQKFTVHIIYTGYLQFSLCKQIFVRFYVTESPF